MDDLLVFLSGYITAIYVARIVKGVTRWRELRCEQRRIERLHAIADRSSTSTPEV